MQPIGTQRSSLLKLAWRNLVVFISLVTAPEGLNGLRAPISTGRHAVRVSITAAVFDTLSLMLKAITLLFMTVSMMLAVIEETMCNKQPFQSQLKGLDLLKHGAYAATRVIQSRHLIMLPLNCLTSADCHSCWCQPR